MDKNLTKNHVSAGAHHLASAAMSVLPRRLKREAMHVWRHGRPLPLTPTTFNEKVQYRILKDRREKIGLACDKLYGKHLAESIGLRAPKTYWAGDDASDLPADLPSQWFAKPNHRTQVYMKGGGAIHPDVFRQATKGWLDDDLESIYGQWGYSQARKLILIEEFMSDGSGDLPDYKFFCFDGKARLVLRDQEKMTIRRFYTPEWEPLDVKHGGVELAEPIAKPAALTDMIHFAEKLSQGYDFLRVDLYTVNEEPLFGELSPYPTSGLRKFEPASFDRELGSWWNMVVK